MKISHNTSLKKYNTFGIEATAARFATISSEEDLVSLLKKPNDLPYFVLSGGSNMLLTKDLDYFVLHIDIKGITIKNETPSHVTITANAGENWHDFVQYCILKNYGGIENLSLIPGYVGSAPIQNIGAYGVELKDSFVQCEALQIASGIKKVFTKEDCQFGYRNSIFKNEVKGDYIITNVTFQLSKKDHELHINYGAIKDALSKNEVQKPTIKDVADAVISIRQSKLPDPAVIGNSGSFFKNPVITNTQFNVLQKQYPEAPFYKIDDLNTKVPAGWLIEQAGFKGKRWGDAGVHNKQALVLVNYDNATGSEILALSKKIQDAIQSKFNITLETEVNII